MVANLVVAIKFAFWITEINDGKNYDNVNNEIIEACDDNNNDNDVNKNNKNELNKT